MYKPYHPWRHGYKRERRKRWFFRIAALLLIAEGLVLTTRYIKANTFEHIYESEMYWSESEEKDNARADAGNKSGVPAGENEREVFGIGFDADEKVLFWFRKLTETSGI